MANLRDLRKIGGIINSTDLNYNFKVLQEDVQGAIQGLIFSTGYASVELIEDRNNIPTSELVPGYWCAVAQTGKVYEYNVDNDLPKAATNRWFGPNDGDLPGVPYVVDGDPDSEEWLNAWYIMRSDKANNWEYESITLGNEKFYDGDWAIWHKVNGVYKWVRVPKWVEIMNLLSILEQHLIGKLKDLHTENKESIVGAINEIHDDLGTLTDLTTTEKGTAVGAINELDKEIGPLDTLHTENKNTVVESINEVHDDLGTLDDLTTSNKGTMVLAVNELDKEMGDLSQLHTEKKDNMVNALNEVHDDLGTLSDLTTTDKNTAVAAINELDKDLGAPADLKTEKKDNTVNAINEIHDDLGTIADLTTTRKDNAVEAINELKAITDTLKGAYIYIGTIDALTKDVTQADLTARAKVLTGKTTLQTGWVIVDREQHEWYYSEVTSEWIDMEQPNVYPATNSVMGTVIGSETGDVSITDGVMTVQHSADSSKLGGQLPAYYATKEYCDTKADKVNVLELDNTTRYEPTLPYHPATKEYVDEMATGGIWGEIVGNMDDQEDLKNALDDRPIRDELLTKTNTMAYTPTDEFNPATKGYVDGMIAAHKNWGQIEGNIADQTDLQNELLKKQDVETAWNTTNLVVGTQQPAIPLEGTIIWIDTNA